MTLPIFPEDRHSKKSEIKQMLRVSSPHFKPFQARFESLSGISSHMQCRGWEPPFATEMAAAKHGQEYSGAGNAHPISQAAHTGHCRNTELRAPRVPSKSLKTTWGWKSQTLNPWVPHIPPWAGDAPLGGQLRKDLGTQGKFPHLPPQPRHIQQLSLPPNPGTVGTPIPGYAGKPPGTTFPALLSSAWQVPHIPCSSTQPKICFVRGFGLGFFWFWFFF